MQFRSDNNATACPEILDAIVRANVGLVVGYGDDPWSRRLDDVYSAFFEKRVRVFPVSTGTAANALALATLCPPWGAVVAHDEAHVVRDECGAPEFFSAGARLLLVGGDAAKITPAALSKVLDANPTSVHTVQPRAVTLTQATEFGTVYRPPEVAAVSAVARERGLAVHMDGARFANALVTLGCTPADVTWRAGIDVLSFGATKNGALTAEAVVFFDEARIADFEFRRKRAGHLLSKSRYVAAQLLAYVETGVWRRNADAANRRARAIGEAAGRTLMYPVEANEVFVRVGEAAKARLRAEGFEFYDWGADKSGEARFVAAWDHRDEDVAALCAALRRCLETIS